MEDTKTALFTNWTAEPFTGYWDGKGKTFKPGQSLYMPDWKARHYAKHLTNRELQRTDANNNYIYPNGEKMTSPKFPDQVPLYMELFNKAYTPDLGEETSAEEVEVEVLNKNKEIKEEVKATEPVDEFEGKPVE